MWNTNSYFRTSDPFSQEKLVSLLFFSAPFQYTGFKSFTPRTLLSLSHIPLLLRLAHSVNILFRAPMSPSSEITAKRDPVPVLLEPRFWLRERLV